MFCVNCSASNPSQSRFCNACGRALIQSDSVHAPAGRWPWLLAMVVLLGFLGLLYSATSRSPTRNIPVSSPESPKKLASPTLAESPDSNLSDAHGEELNQRVAGEQSDPPLVNVVLHPYDLVQNPFLYKHKLIRLDVSSLPVFLNGTVIAYRPGADERYARLGYTALRFEKMLSEDEASYEVRALDVDTEGNFSMLGQLIVIVPANLPRPLAIDNEWLVEPLGSAQGTNAFGASVLAPMVRFVRYRTVQEVGTPHGSGVTDVPTGRAAINAVADDPPRAGEKGYGMPVCLYCPQPGFSDEAIKAKHFDGVVVLEALVTPEGRAINVHVVKPVGLGLDIKAVEIVPTWWFKPALAPDGRAASVVTRIECKFHLDSNVHGMPK